MATTTKRTQTYSESTASQSTDDTIHDVQQILGKRYYAGQIYYKIKCFALDDPIWESAKNLRDKFLIKQYERSKGTGSDCGMDDDDDEWDVEKILDKREREDGNIEYLVKWKGWPGEPTWELAENCKCVNLIAAFENPKLEKMWNFTGSNQRLWLDRSSMLTYMRRYLRKLDTPFAQLLRFQINFPEDEKPFTLKEGINIGPICYENHWYLIIILVNHICITRKILICDSLNTLIGVKKKDHPVVKRLEKVYPRFTIQPLAMTQMDRSDVCAYYTLAAFERAIFLLDPRAHFIVDSIFFDRNHAERIRSKIRPETNGELSAALPIVEAFDPGYTCEFCKKMFESRQVADQHISSEHIDLERPNR